MDVQFTAVYANQKNGFSLYSHTLGIMKNPMNIFGTIT